MTGQTFRLDASAGSHSLQDESPGLFSVLGFSRRDFYRVSVLSRRVACLWLCAASEPESDQTVIRWTLSGFRTGSGRIRGIRKSEDGRNVDSVGQGL